MTPVLVESDGGAQRNREAWLHNPVPFDQPHGAGYDFNFAIGAPNQQIQELGPSGVGKRSSSDGALLSSPLLI